MGAIKAEPVLTTAEEEEFFNEENDSDFNQDKVEEAEECKESKEDLEEKAKQPVTVKESAKKSPEKLSKKTQLVAKVTELVGKMKITKRFGMSFWCPGIMLDHVINNRDIITVGLLVPKVHKQFVKPQIAHCGTKFIVTITIPFSSAWQDLHPTVAANVDNVLDFNHDTSKATRFQKICKEASRQNQR